MLTSSSETKVLTLLLLIYIISQVIFQRVKSLLIPNMQSIKVEKVQPTILQMEKYILKASKFEMEQTC